MNTHSSNSSIFYKYLMLLLFTVSTAVSSISAAFAFQFSIEVTSDKELYQVGESAHFTVVIYKGGGLLPDDNTVVEATFPDESTPVLLTNVSPGVFTYDTTLSSAGQNTLTVKVSHDYSSAIAAMESKIANLEQEIAELEAQLAIETDPNKQRILQAKLDNRNSMVAKFLEKIANLVEPKAVGMKTITVEASVPLTLKWLNIMNGVQADGLHNLGDMLSEGKLSILAALLIPISDADLYYVSLIPGGTPLDESKTFQELGITVDGTFLYVGLIFSAEE